MEEHRGDFKVVSCNVTAWKTAMFQWVKSHSDTIFAVHETHLSEAGAIEMRAHSQKIGMHWFGGQGSDPNPGIKGGVALIAPATWRGKLAKHCNHEGCGFVAVEFLWKANGLLVISLYLHRTQGVKGPNNIGIIAELLSLVKNVPHWIIVGDFNVDVEDFCATNIAQEMKGMVRSTYQPTIDSGSCIDFAITSRSMIPLTTIQEDWTAPIKPHAAVILAVHESLGYWPLPQLKGFQGDLHEHTAVQGIIADVTMSNDPVMLAFPLFSFKVEESNYEKRQGRGWRNPLVMQPLLKTVYPGTWIGQGVAIWDRVSRALVPRSLTQLPHYARGRESIKRTGCWSNPSLFSLWNGRFWRCGEQRP